MKTIPLRCLYTNQLHVDYLETRKFYYNPVIYTVGVTKEKIEAMVKEQQIAYLKWLNPKLEVRI